MPIYEIRYAPYVWRLLNGGFCVYKPNNKSIKSTRNAILSKLSHELNSMECRPPREVVHISGELSTNDSLKVESIPSFADNPLVVGPRYQPKDFALSIVNNPGFFASGVVVVFIGKMAKNADDFRNEQHLKVYEMKGRLGFATNNFRADGKIVEKSRYKHVTEGHIGRVISKMQAFYQTVMYKTIGVDLKSEEAFQMAAKGMIRPAMRKTAPVVYGIRLTEFSSPDFTLEVECINEFDEYMFGIINDIGLKLKTSAMCTQLRLKRYGPFTAEHSLLFKHWTSEHIIENIKICQNLLKTNLFQPLSPVLGQQSVPSDQDIFLETLKQSEGINK